MALMATWRSAASNTRPVPPLGSCSVLVHHHIQTPVQAVFHLHPSIVIEHQCVIAILIDLAFTPTLLLGPCGHHSAELSRLNPLTFINGIRELQRRLALSGSVLICFKLGHYPPSWSLDITAVQVVHSCT